MFVERKSLSERLQQLAAVLAVPVRPGRSNSACWEAGVDCFITKRTTVPISSSREENWEMSVGRPLVEALVIATSRPAHSAGSKQSKR
jgi:hypothetical protein